MKKILPILLVVVVLGSFGAAGFPDRGIFVESLCVDPDDVSSDYGELDQYQTNLETVGFVGSFSFLPDKNFSVAQSFIPQKEVLTRVEVLIGRNTSTTYPYVLAIREDLMGENLASVGVDADDIPVAEDISDFEWVEFDFGDVWLTVGGTYYMVSYTANVTDNIYGWGANLSDLYPNGSVFVSDNDGASWSSEPDADMCFKTYGLDSTILEIVVTKDLFRPSVAIRNAGNVTAYNVRWSFNITGGILSRINGSIGGNVSELDPGKDVLITMGFILGFGKIRIMVSACALNAREVFLEMDGFVLLFFIILL